MNLAEMLAAADAATQNIEVSNDFQPIPPGEYVVTVTGAEGPVESKRTNPANPAEHGQYLKIECTITGPNCIGRKVWVNNNILVYPSDLSAENVKRSQTAMAMGAKERKVMLDSIGKTGIENASELIGATFVASIVTEKGTNGYKDKSVIKNIKPSGGIAAPSVRQESASAQPASTPSAPKAKMPWEK